MQASCQQQAMYVNTVISTYGKIRNNTVPQVNQQDVNLSTGNYGLNLNLWHAIDWNSDNSILWQIYAKPKWFKG